MTTSVMRRERDAQLAGAFEASVERYRGEIVVYLVRVLGNREDAEDACHDALLRACRAAGQLTDTRQLRAWLYKIATRSAFNALKRQRRSAARYADVDPDSLPARSAGTPPDRRELRQVVRAANGLPAKQRAALMQRLFHDLSYADIGVALNCSPAAARANVYQALKRLRRTLPASTALAEP